MSRPVTLSALVTDTDDDGVLEANQCRVERVVVGVVEASKVISIYDDTDDGSPSNKVAEISCATVGVYELGITLRNGLVAITDATGTARITVVWS